MALSANKKLFFFIVCGILMAFVAGLLVISIVLFYPHEHSDVPFCSPKPQYNSSASAPAGKFPNLSDDGTLSHYKKTAFLPVWGIFFATVHFLMTGLKYCFHSVHPTIFSNYFMRRAHRTFMLAFVNLVVGGSFLTIAIVCGLSLARINGNCALALLKCFELLLSVWSLLYFGTAIPRYSAGVLFVPKSRWGRGRPIAAAAAVLKEEMRARSC